MFIKNYIIIRPGFLTLINFYFRLNLSKYAKNKMLAKALFEYLFYHEGDVRNALELAVQATQYNKFADWWWKVQLAKCYIAVNMIREAEQQLRSALKQHNHIESFVRLTRVYLRLGKLQFSLRLRFVSIALGFFIS